MRLVKERFEEKVVKTSRCWEWIGCKNLDGYGEFWFNGRHEKAHRVAYELYISEIPRYLKVLHHCDNPGCVCPDHLFLGTDYDNVQDRDNKGRQANNSGEKNGYSKLKENDVQIIRKKRSEDVRVSVLSRDFGVSRQTIYAILCGRNWANL